MTVTYSLHSQSLSREDFKVSRFYIDQPIDSAFRFLGFPTKVDTTTADDETFVVYSFQGLTIWVNPHRAISAVDISSKDYSSRRGVIIGDSLSVVERVYGFRKEWQRRKELNRVYDIYDTKFSDYDFLFDYEYREGEYDAKYFAFYFKNNRLVKMYLWRGLSD